MNASYPGFNRTLSTLMLLALTACGGGSSDQAGINGSGLNNGGTDNPAVAVGPITAFGSVFVNGVEFDISNSTAISIDGVSGKSQTDLRIGQVVEIHGTINSANPNGKANSLTFDDNLQGPVSSINLTTQTFVAMNHTVQVSGRTVFANSTDLSTLAVNDVVEVSGFVDSSGWIQATRVEIKTNASPNSNELTGIIGLVNQGSFMLDGTLVNDVGALHSGGNVATNACAEVKGNFVSGQFNALSVEVKPCNLNITSGKGEVEGVITTPVSNNVFSIGSLQVDVSQSVSYSNGVKADLIADAQVEVEGTFNGSGVLVASKIEFKQGTDTRLTGTVGAVSTSAKTLTLFGVTINTNAKTSYVDKMNNPVATFGLGNIQPNDYLEVRGYENSAHTQMTAVTIERRNADTKLEVRGIALPSIANANTLTAPTFKILGITIDTTNASLPGGFYSTGINDLVRVRGNTLGAWTGSQFNADQVEIEEAR